MWGCVFLRRKVVTAAIIILLLILAVIQITFDFIDENKAYEAAKQSEYSIFIEIEDKTLYLLLDGKCIRKYPIASGKKDSPSPIGYWKITDKGDWGEGFGGRWMGLDVPWGKYGIHGTTRPGSVGSAASHGCIRMYNSHVKELYRMVPAGTPVVIVNGCFGPFGRGFKDLNPGDRGADVLAVQQRMKDLGFFKGWASGIYEDDLKNAVHRFQKEKGLEVKNAITLRDYTAMGFRKFE